MSDEKQSGEFWNGDGSVREFPLTEDEREKLTPTRREGTVYLVRHDYIGGVWRTPIHF